MRYFNVYEEVFKRFGFRFPEKNPRETNEYLSVYGNSHKKQERQDATKRKIQNDEGYKRFIEFMTSIQKALKETDDEFAKRFGLKSGKMIARYRRCTGNLPTKETLEKLFELERIVSVRIERGDAKTTNNIYLNTEQENIISGILEKY